MNSFANAADLFARMERLARQLDHDLGAVSTGSGPACNTAVGARHLSRQLVMALQGELEFANPRAPILHRYEQPWVQWGGPNPDNVYRRCAIDPALTYHVWGNARGLRGLIVSQVDGDMHLGNFGVFEERTLAELDVADDGTFSFAIGPQPSPVASMWIPSHALARQLLVREYYTDWSLPSAEINVECVDHRGTPRADPTDAEVCEAFDRAASWVEKSMTFWKAYAEGARTRIPANVFGAPTTLPGGAPNIAYGAGWFSLNTAVEQQPQVLLIECDAPDADYWGWTLHTQFWFDSGDFASRQTSLNCEQMHIDDDGRIRIVIAATDPGTPNWIDISNNPEGMIVYRYVGARTKPVPSAQLIAAADLRGALPATHPSISPAQRLDSLAQRAASVYRR